MSILVNNFEDMDSIHRQIFINVLKESKISTNIVKKFENEI
jgi:hypothetical protein